MAIGDDDVTIKLAADINDAVKAFAELITSFKDIDKVIEVVEKSAKEAGTTTQDFLDTFQKSLAQSSFAATDLGKNFAATLQQVEDTLAKTTTAATDTSTALTDVGTSAQTAGAATAEGMVTVATLLETVTGLTKEYHTTAAEGAARMSALTDEEKVAIVALSEAMLESGKSLQGVADKTGLTVDQVKALITEQETLRQSTVDSIGPVERLASVTKSYRDQQAADLQRVSQLSAEEKEKIAAATAELVKQGQSFQQVAESAGVTVGVLQSVIKEQEDLKNASKSFFESWIDGIKGSEVATVTAGVLMADALKSVGEAVMDLVTGFPAMITAAAAAGDEIQTLANRFNISVEAVDKMKFVADQANVSMESMGKTSQKLSSELADDTSKASKAFAEMGLNAEELRKDPEKALYAFVEAVKTTVPASDQAAKFTEVLGNRAGTLTGLLKENIPALLADADALGASAEATRIVAEEGEAYQDNIGRIHRAQEAFRDELASHFLPVINDVLHAMPGVGGALLTVGEALWDTGAKLVPLIGNFILYKAIQGQTAVATQAVAVAQGEQAIAAQAATVATGEAAVATTAEGVAAGEATVTTTTLAVAEGELALAAGAAGTVVGTEAVAMEGLAVAEGTAAAATGVAETAMWGLNAALGPIAIVLGGILLAWKAWEGATAESGWLRDISDEVEYYTLRLMQYSEAEARAMIATDHATQKALEEADALKKKNEALEKAAEEAKKLEAMQDAAAAKRGTALQQLAKESKDVQDAYHGLKEEQKAQIKASLETGKSAKDIAIILRREMKVSTDVATEAINLYSKALKEAEKEGKKSPFQKLMKDAVELATAMREATAAGFPLNVQIDQFGKKAEDIVREAALSKHLDRVDSKIKQVAATFNAEQLADKLKPVNEKALELARTFNDKVTTAAAAATAAMKNMTAEMNASLLTGDALKENQIQRQLDSQIAALEAQKAALDKQNADLLVSYKDNADKQIEIEKASAKARGDVITTEREAQIQAEQKALAEAAIAENNGVKAKYTAQQALAKENADLQRQLYTATTASYEVNAQIRGVITDEAAKKELEIEKQKLELMKDERSHATAFEIEEQTKKIAELQDLTEKDLRQRGIATQEAALKIVDIERKKLEKLKALNDPFYKEQIRQQEAVVTAAEEAADAFERDMKGMGITTRRVAADHVKIERDKLTALKNLDDPFYEAQIRAQQKVVDEARRAAGELVVNWESALGNLAQSFDQFGQVAGGSFGKVLSQGGGILKGLQDWKASGNKFGDLSVAMDKTKDGMTRVQGGINSALAVAQGVQNVIAATDKRTRGGRALGGAMAGAQAGAAFGPYGMAVGAAAGFIAGLVRGKPAWAKVTDEVAKGFGVKISDEMGKAIAKEAKEKYKGNRQVAEIANLDKIISEAGGVNEKNVNQLTARLRDTFSLVAQGQLKAEEGREVLDKSFGAFADHILKSGKVASKQFQEIIKLNKESGLASEQVIGFVTDQAGRLGANIATLVSAAEAPIKSVTETIGEFSAIGKKQLADDYKIAKEGADKFGGSFEDFVSQQATFYNTLEEGDARLKTTFYGGDLEIWNKQQEAIKHTGEQMARLERLTLASFNAAVAGGTSYLDALTQMGPALDKINEANKKVGRQGSEAINELLRFREVAGANKELVESAGSLNEVMLALSNIGGLNTETMADLQAQGSETFAQLQAAGFTETQSLQQMKGFLTGVRDAHKEMGLPIDENTQKLIDQAEEQGILKKEQMSTNDIMLQGLGAIIEAVGGKLPDAFKKMQDQAVAAATTVGKAIDTTVKASVEDTSKQIVDTPWAGYAAKGAAAAMVTGGAIGKVDTSVVGVGKSLDNTDWSGWSEDAVNAAREAQAAVDAVSLGSSPGGIKEIPITLKKAMEAFKQWEQQGVISSAHVRAAVEGVKGQAAGRAGINAAMKDSATAEDVHQQEMVNAMMDMQQQVQEQIAEQARNATPINFTIQALDGADVKKVVEEKVQPALIESWKRGRGITALKEVVGG